jgi:hypothetical protein
MSEAPPPLRTAITAARWPASCANWRATQGRRASAANWSISPDAMTGAAIILTGCHDRKSKPSAGVGGGHTHADRTVPSHIEWRCLRTAPDRTRVTFDSNEWEDVVCPERCLKTRPERYPDLVKVQNALKAGCVRGFICAVVATLEGVRRKERAEFLAKQSIEPRVLEAVLPDGTTSPIVIMVPDQSHRPTLSSTATPPIGGLRHLETLDRPR